ncbi:hypothetical protein CQW23_16927 [Capsicum baccatum]|uniref:tRNA pseudouridine synthase n=1 Tax=Capsicum baccatum TaxID=33114 RepID=A0A2G2WCH7_CAPBA|nr:hypothetical protein CQW23_16927 [Capsicum baccatum]
MKEGLSKTIEGDQGTFNLPMWDSNTLRTPRAGHLERGQYKTGGPTSETMNWRPADHEDAEIREDHEKSEFVSFPVKERGGRWARINFKIVLSYHGGSFDGWQKQPDMNTVQGLIERSLGEFVDEKKAQLLKDKNLPLEGCAVVAGRTDKGVSASQQVCSFCSDSQKKSLFLNLSRAILQVWCIFYGSSQHTFSDEQCIFRRSSSGTVSTVGQGGHYNFGDEFLHQIAGIRGTCSRKRMNTGSETMWTRSHPLLAGALMRYVSTLNWQEDISNLRWLRSSGTQGLLLRVTPFTGSSGHGVLKITVHTDFEVEQDQDRVLECKFSDLSQEADVVVKLDYQAIWKENFKYLGSMIKGNGEINEDVTHRIAVGLIGYELNIGSEELPYLKVAGDGNEDVTMDVLTYQE